MKSLLKKGETGVPSPKTKKRRRAAAALCAVLVVLGSVFFLARGRGARGQTPSYTEASVESRRIVSSLTGSGTLQPANSYTVTTLVEGDILSAAFEEGDIVEKDTVLYEIDSSDAANNIEKSQLSLNQAQRSRDSAVDSRQVRAAISGSVYSLLVDVGDEVTQGQEIAVLRESGTMELTVPFPADDAKEFKVGQAAEVLLDGSFETLSGTVTAVSGSAVTVDASRLAGASLKDAHIRYYALNQQSEISILILNDATGDAWSYGYLTYVSDNAQKNEDGSKSVDYSYTYYLDGEKTVLQTGSRKFDVQDHSGAAFSMDRSGNVKEMKNLAPVSLTQLGTFTARSENRTYTLAEDLQVYLKEDGFYYPAERNAVDEEDYTLTGFYDQMDCPAGGLIRVILAEKK